MGFFFQQQHFYFRFWFAYKLFFIGTVNNDHPRQEEKGIKMERRKEIHTRTRAQVREELIINCIT